MFCKDIQKTGTQNILAVFFEFCTALRRGCRAFETVPPTSKVPVRLRLGSEAGPEYVKVIKRPCFHRITCTSGRASRSMTCARRGRSEAGRSSGSPPGR